METHFKEEKGCWRKGGKDGLPEVKAAKQV